MNPTFYARSLVLSALLLTACAKDPTPTPLQGPESGVFVIADSDRGAWLPPENDDWVGRWIAHLRSGSREGQRFALAQLREEGAAIGPLLAAEIHEAALLPSNFGLLVNLLAALGASGDASQGLALADVIRHHPTPVARSAAAEAVASLRAADALPALREAIPREMEIGPRRAMLIAVGRIGGSEAVEFLENRARVWISESGLGELGNDNGDSWNALMLIEGQESRPALVRLDPILPPPLRVQSLTARIEMGDRTVGPTLREYLNAELYPSAKTRSLALTALAELRDWEAVLSVAGEEDLAMQHAVAKLLGLPAAVEAQVGADWLDVWLASPDEELRNAALAGLLARGQRQRLDPYLQLVREFPLRAGSTDALLLLTKPEFRDPRLPGILVGCWERAQGTHRMDILRALTKIQAAEAPALMARVLNDAHEDLEVRRLTAALIANFDGCVQPLIQWYQAEPGAERAADLLGGLGRRLEVVEARAALLFALKDPQAPDAARRTLLDALPLIFGFEAAGILQEIRSVETRSDVRAYLDSLLRRWF